MIIKNQKGSATLFSMLIFLALLVLLLSTFRNHLIHLNDHLSAQKAFTCLKNYNSIQRSYINKVNQANKYIKLITIGSWSSDLISLFLPGLSLTKIATNKALKILKNYQYLETIHYFAKRAKLLSQSCLINSTNNFHYYEFTSMKFKRDRYGATILRRKTWNQKIIARKVTFLSQVQLKSAFHKINYQSQMILIGSKGALY